MNGEQVISLVFAEIARAHEKHGDFPKNLFERIAIITEELGELSQATIDFKYGKGKFEDIAKEAVQTTAMGFKFLLSLKNEEEEKENA